VRQVLSSRRDFALAHGSLLRSADTDASGDGGNTVGDDDDPLRALASISGEMAPVDPAAAAAAAARRIEQARAAIV
jgi:hypothetical protein